MFRLLSQSLRHVHWRGPCSVMSVSSVKPKLVQLRSCFPHTPGRLTKQSFSTTSSSVMGEFPSDVCQGAGTLDNIIARSKSSPNVQKKILELPEVARIPTRKRTFHLNHEELETLVRPLLSCHWHASRVGDAADGLQVFSLNKLFSFKGFRSAVEFFDALTDVQNEEEHHARVTVDCAHVYVSVHTHIAYAYQQDSGVGVDAKPIRIPGLTARDVRFAVKVERLHERFLSDERAVTKVPVESTSIETWSMEQLQRRYPALHP